LQDVCGFLKQSPKTVPNKRNNDKKKIKEEEKKVMAAVHLMHLDVISS